MNSRISTWSKILCIVLIPVFFATGCAKRDAQKAIEQAKQAQTQAQDAKAPRFAKEEYNDANRLMNNAQQQFDSGEYKQSIETAQTAEQRFLAAAAAAPAVEQRVMENQQKVEDVLANADTNIEQARQSLEPEQVNPVAAKVDDIRNQLIDEYRTVTDQEQWDSLLANANDVLEETQALATAHLKPKAQEAIDEINTLLARAQELKADVHVPDQYNQVVENIKQLEQLQSDGKWQEVIDEADNLTQPINDVIVSAQEKAAGDIIEETQGMIDKAQQLQVADAPEFGQAVQQAQDTLKTGKTNLQNQEYGNAIAAADDAKAYLEQAYQILGDKAQVMIDQAKANLQEAMDREIETYAPSVLQKVQSAIAEIETLLENEQYTSAFQSAQQVVDASAKAIEAARRGKAQMALQKAKQPFNLLKSQGGEQYAKEAFAVAQGAYQQLVANLNNGQYEAVVEGVTDTVAVVQDAINELALAAEGHIEKAETALQEAEQADAREWVPVQYKQAQSAKTSAEANLEKKEYLSAIRNAESVVEKSNAAESKAYQLQAQQNASKAERLITEAKRANQQKLSPLAYANAVQAQKEVASLLKQNKNQEAYQASLEMVEKSDRALNNLVYSAKEATDAALEAEAMQYAEADVKQALTLYNEAEEAQNSDNYSTANQQAQKAIELAKQAEYQTWKQRSTALIMDLEGLKLRLDNHLASQKTPALYRDALVNFAEAKIENLEQDYEKSFDYAAKADATEELIWDTMKNRLSQKSEELTKMAEWLGENAMDQSGRELKIHLMDAIAELDRQIQLGNWRTGFEAAAQADQVAQQTIDEMKQNNRVVMATKLENLLQPYSEVDAVSIVPEDQALFNQTQQDIANDATDYTSAYQNYQKSLETIENLPDNIQNYTRQRIDEIARILQQAFEAEAPKYFKDWYRELSSDLQWLRNSTRGNDYEGIAKRLKKLEKEAPELLNATQVAIAEDNYLEQVEYNIQQMRTLLQDFGPIADMPKQLFVAASMTEHTMDTANVSMYKSLQQKISAKSFRINAEILEDRVKELEPPESLEKVHKNAILSFMYFRKAAEGFEIFGNNDVHDLEFRERRIEYSYDYLDKTIDLNEKIMAAIHNHRKLSTQEKVWQTIDTWQREFGEFYYSYRIR